MGDYADALAAADRGIALHLDSPQQDNAGFLYNIRGLVHLQREQLADAEADLNFGLDPATIYRIDRLEGICATNLAWTPLRASRWEEAADAADRGLVRLTSVGITEAVTAQILAEVAAEAPDLSTGGAERLKRRPRRRAGTATSTRPRPPSSRG
jgi:tetratricopeptide (TPR) repeat protein